ncbi:MAG TPA: NAD(P)(+) transhydrogenase (Re/Si-specific) subunit beta [Lacipirellulaceae bacterium]|nr:NAD(P)(+) transhydrogenase (Re/Si-specific) subunit beta [Lacipirellulaceae bacterium]
MTNCTAIAQLLAVATPAESADIANSWFGILSYLIAAGLFILSLKWLSHPRTARRGVHAGEIGMVIAVIGTLLIYRAISYELVFTGMVIGTLIGAPMAIWMPMTAVPQRTALSHAFGALAAALVGTAHYYRLLHDSFAHQLYFDHFTMGVLAMEVYLGSLTFTGSCVAFGKLQELIPSRIKGLPQQNAINFSLLGAAVLVGIWLTASPLSYVLFPILILLGLTFGIFLVMPIGGADMPTVISLLNSYAGLSASLMGFVLDNYLLIVAGALDGSSGLILSIIMCRAMNRSFTNVLFGRMGTASDTSADDVYGGKVKSCTPEDVAAMLEGVRRVVVVPGYGMAVAQAQHAVRELFNQLEERGTDVEFAIHPVAGRMPGHMNVLLAEADIPYDKLKEMDEINPSFAQTDVVIVIGANDVVNPLANTDPKSPIAGMPILNVGEARTVVVVKRSLSPGFAGIPNPLFAADNTLMLFEDGKKAVVEIVAAMKASA